MRFLFRIAFWLGVVLVLAERWRAHHVECAAAQRERGRFGGTGNCERRARAFVNASQTPALSDRRRQRRSDIGRKRARRCFTTT